MRIMNYPGQLDTFISNNGRLWSKIDVTFCSEGLAPGMTSWEVLPYATTSDHSLIVATFGERHEQASEVRRRRYIMSQANWPLFARILRGTVESWQDQQDQIWEESRIQVKILLEEIRTILQSGMRCNLQVLIQTQVSMMKVGVCDKMKKNLGSGTDIFQAWFERHNPNCQKNFDGSSLAMETEAAERIWKRSE
ncbi:hypothetical protein J6590_097089 [Homalodisca vitripennis]|nr:hypothetical protein J6590_097089 [Homalodisca vitripennis]